MEVDDIYYFMCYVITHDFSIPLDHAYEAAFEQYPVLPLIMFVPENGNWKKFTLLCIEDDHSGYKRDLFIDKIERAYANREHWRATKQIYDNRSKVCCVEQWTYMQLRHHVKYIEEDEIYNFRYLFHLFGDTIVYASILVDERNYDLNEFEMLDVVHKRVWEVSPAVDNGKTMKRNLEEMTERLMEKVRARDKEGREWYEREWCEQLAKRPKLPKTIGYDDELSEQEL